MVLLTAVHELPPQLQQTALLVCGMLAKRSGSGSSTRPATQLECTQRRCSDTVKRCCLSLDAAGDVSDAPAAGQLRRSGSAPYKSTRSNQAHAQHWQCEVCVRYRAARRSGGKLRGSTKRR